MVRQETIVRGIWNAVQNHQSHDMERKQESEATSGRLAANKNEGQKASSDIGRIQIRKQTIEDGEWAAAGFSLPRWKEVSAHMKYRVIYKHRETYAISTMCRFFSVSHSGYYDFVRRTGEPDRDEPLKELIEERRAGRYGKTLGCRRMKLWLAQKKQLHYNYKTV